EQMKYMVRIESLDSRENNHRRGTIRMNTGFPADMLAACGTGYVKVPHFGSIVSYYVGNSDVSLPFFSAGSTATQIGPAFLGKAYAAFPVQNPGTVPEKLGVPQIGDNSQTMARANRRKELLGLLEENFRGAVAPHLTEEADRKAFADASQEHAELL